MEILFDDRLSSEAKFAKEVIGEVFGIESGISHDRCEKYFKYNNTVRGYETAYPGAAKGWKIILTNKDVFVEGASSRNDDYLFGSASDYRVFWIACPRLRSKTEEPAEKLQVSKSLYLKRLRYLIVHELGHIFVKKQGHFRDYTIVNPDTGHKTPTGTHCLNKKCVMSQVEDAVMLDQRLKILNKTLFCRKCRHGLEIPKTLRAS